MIPPSDDRKLPITPQLAMRVAILGGIAVAIFAIIFFRLWFLQILSGNEYLANANDNRVRDISTQAPRGEVLDRNGTVMIGNRVALSVQVDPDKLPESGAAKQDVYRRLGAVIGMSGKHVREEIVRQHKLVPYSNSTVKADVSRSAYTYLFEHQDQFPGVTVQRVYLRSYPHKTVAAQLFGTVGEISPDQLKTNNFPGAKQGMIVGKDGIELQYDRYLRGRNGAVRVQVDSLGRPKGELATRDPEQGKQLRLSIDFDLQRGAQDAMGQVIGLSGTGASKGAFVAMDPRNGEVMALGSYPTFDPTIFTKPLSTAKYNELNSEESGAPLVNRAIAGGYPTGSTFKAITALAALESGTIGPDTPINDPGSIRIGDVTFNNDGKKANGPIALRRALGVSSDVFFYTLGARMNGGSNEPLQRWARKLGLDKPTGIDLPGEFRGLVPDAKWRNNLYKKKQTDRRWAIGDNVNLSVGQGDVQVTPLQMATAYSAIANGGKVVRPHLGLGIEDSLGRTIERITPPARRDLDIQPEYRQAILDGLAQVTTGDGTAADVFRGFPHKVLGKTGTAETAQGLQSWFMAYAPDPRRPLVVAVTVEQGGYGAETAAPAARLILSQWFDVAKKVVQGKSQTG